MQTLLRTGDEVYRGADATGNMCALYPGEMAEFPEDFAADLVEAGGFTNLGDLSIINASLPYGSDLQQILLPVESELLDDSDEVGHYLEQQTGTLSGTPAEEEIHTGSSVTSAYTASGDPAFIIHEVRLRIVNPMSGTDTASIVNPYILWGVGLTSASVPITEDLSTGAWVTFQTPPIYTDPDGVAWNTTSISNIDAVSAYVTLKNFDIDPFGPYVGAIQVSKIRTFVYSQTAPTAPIWVDPAVVATLPVSGAAWDRVSVAANANWVTGQRFAPLAGTTANLRGPNFSNQSSVHPAYVMAGALYYARTGNAAMRQKVLDALLAETVLGNTTIDPNSGARQNFYYCVNNDAPGTRPLGVGRQLEGYVIAADLIDLRRFDPASDAIFRAWIEDALTIPFITYNTEYGNTLVKTHESNAAWGLEVGKSRISIEMYLGNHDNVLRCWDIFRSYFTRGFYPQDAFNATAANHDGYFLQNLPTTWCPDNSYTNWLAVSDSLTKTDPGVSVTCSSHSNNVLDTPSTPFWNDTDSRQNNSKQILIGDLVTGSGIPDSTVVLSVSPTSLTISNNATNSVAASRTFVTPGNIDITGCIPTEHSRIQEGQNPTAFTWPLLPGGRVYGYETFGCIVGQAQMLKNYGIAHPELGIDPFNYPSTLVRGIKRIADFNTRAGLEPPYYPDNNYINWVLNKNLGGPFYPTYAIQVGKPPWATSWTDWTHA